MEANERFRTEVCGNTTTADKIAQSHDAAGWIPRLDDPVIRRQTMNPGVLQGCPMMATIRSPTDVRFIDWCNLSFNVQQALRAGRGAGNTGKPIRRRRPHAPYPKRETLAATCRSCRPCWGGRGTMGLLLVDKTPSKCLTTGMSQLELYQSGGVGFCFVARQFAPVVVASHTPGGGRVAPIACLSPFPESRESQPRTRPTPNCQRTGNEGAMPNGEHASQTQAFNPGQWHSAPGESGPYRDGRRMSGCTNPDTSAVPIEEDGRKYQGSMPGSGYRALVPTPDVVCADHRPPFSTYTGYSLPVDGEEQDRLDLSHHCYKLLLDGRLTLAPFEKLPKRVLDVATGRQDLSTAGLLDGQPCCMALNLPPPCRVRSEAE